MPKCRVCGCEDLSACWDDELNVPCHWMTEDLCSVCFRKEGNERANALSGQVGMLMASIDQCVRDGLRPAACPDRHGAAG